MINNLEPANRMGMNTIIFMIENESLCTSSDFHSVLSNNGFGLYECSYSKIPFLPINEQRENIALVVYPEVMLNGQFAKGIEYIKDLQSNGVKTYAAGYWFEEFFREWKITSHSEYEILKILSVSHYNDEQHLYK